MRRGTTPTVEIETNISPIQFESLFVSLRQGDVLISKRVKTSSDSNIITVELTEEESMELTAYAPISVQLKGVARNGKVMASEIWYSNDIGDILDETLIGGSNG